MYTGGSRLIGIWITRIRGQFKVLHVQKSHVNLSCVNLPALSTITQFEGFSLVNYAKVPVYIQSSPPNSRASFASIFFFLDLNCAGCFLFVVKRENILTFAWSFRTVTLKHDCRSLAFSKSSWKRISFGVELQFNPIPGEKTLLTFLFVRDTHFYLLRPPNWTCFKHMCRNSGFDVNLQDGEKTLHWLVCLTEAKVNANVTLCWESFFLQSEQMVVFL